MGQASDSREKGPEDSATSCVGAGHSAALPAQFVQTAPGWVRVAAAGRLPAQPQPAELQAPPAPPQPAQKQTGGIKPSRSALLI